MILSIYKNENQETQQTTTTEHPALGQVQTNAVGLNILIGTLTWNNSVTSHYTKKHNKIAIEIA